MNTETHTGLPWIEQDMPHGMNDRITADDGEGKTICEFPYGLDANSAFIVRACNAHDELVAALKFAKESIVQNRTLDEARNDRALNEAMVAIENRISRALAKAGA